MPFITKNRLTALLYEVMRDNPVLAEIIERIVEFDKGRSPFALSDESIGVRADRVRTALHVTELESQWDMSFPRVSTNRKISSALQTHLTRVLGGEYAIQSVHLGHSQRNGPTVRVDLTWHSALGAIQIDLSFVLDKDVQVISIPDLESRTRLQQLEADDRLRTRLISAFGSFVWRPFSEGGADRALDRTLQTPANLAPEGVRAVQVIRDQLHEDGREYTGGCRAFYSPTEWRERGEAYGADAVLLVVHDGGDLCDYFSPIYDDGNSNAAARMAERLTANGLRSENCTNWYSAIYLR